MTTSITEQRLNSEIKKRANKIHGMERQLLLQYDIMDVADCAFMESNDEAVIKYAARCKLTASAEVRELKALLGVLRGMQMNTKKELATFLGSRAKNLNSKKYLKKYRKDMMMQHDINLAADLTKMLVDEVARTKNDS